jgi:cytochrome P450
MKLLSPAALESLRAGFEAEAEKLVDRLLSEDKVVDAHKDIGAAFVLKVFPDLLGVIPQGRENLLRYGDIAFNSTVPINDIYHESLEKNGDAIAWLDKQCERDAVSPDGMASRIYALADTGQVERDEAAALVRAMLTGGFDTTVMSMSSGLHYFARQPEQWDYVRADPVTMVKSAYDEILRYDPPSRFLGRGVVADVEVEGVPLRAGSRVVCFLTAAGRDERKWEQPDSFDVRRKPAGGLSFGLGLHACLGQSMARLEFSCLGNVLARRIKRFEPAGDPERLVNNQANGWYQVPLRLHAA